MNGWADGRTVRQDGRIDGHNTHNTHNTPNTYNTNDTHNMTQHKTTQQNNNNNNSNYKKTKKLQQTDGTSHLLTCNYYNEMIIIKYDKYNDVLLCEKPLPTSAYQAIWECCNNHVHHNKHS